MGRWRDEKRACSPIPLGLHYGYEDNTEAQRPPIHHTPFLLTLFPSFSYKS